MANTFSPATIDFHGQEVMALAETVFEGFFNKPELSLFHQIVPNIKAKKQVVILAGFTGLFGLGAGECDPTPNTSGFGASQKFWNPVAISDRIKRCWSGNGGLEETFFIWGLKNGIDKYDLTATDYFNFLGDILLDAMIEAVFRIAWLNDTNADDYAGGGVITNGTPLAAFNRIDGFWVQFFAIVAADSARLTTGVPAARIATLNAGANYAAQAFTAADITNRTVSQALLDTALAADTRLSSSADKIFIVTKSVGDQYIRELDNNTLPYTLDVIMNGLSSISRAGITVYVFDFIDRMIDLYFNNGTKWYLPHRIVLTTTTNLQVGTEEESNFTTFEAFYSRETKNCYIDFLFNIDAKVALDHLVQLVY